MKRKLAVVAVLLGLMVLASVFVWDVGPRVEYAALQEAPCVEEDTIPDPPGAYGIPLEGFVIEQVKVRPGATFGDLLMAHGVSAARVDSLVRLAIPHFDVRRMRAGHPIAYIFTDDDDRQLRYFVYEVDLVEHVVFHVEAPLSVHVGHRPVQEQEHAVVVEVTGALYNDLARAGADPLLSLKLAEVFAWTVDFHRIHKGDRFTLVYQERTVDGQRHGEPVVLAARYESGDHSREAFRFNGQEGVGYFDAEGNSLRKAFLKAPLQYSRITSGFSMKRLHPVQKVMKAHLGTDYAAPYGTPILAVGDGVVEAAGHTGGNGNFVKIRHNGTYSTQYLHMRKILVRQGQRVKQGDVIGEVGSTGLATGPHVCFRFWKNGRQVDHRREEFPSAEPVLASERARFFSERDDRLLALAKAANRHDRTVVF